MADPKILLDTTDINIQRPMTAATALAITGTAQWPIISESVFDGMNSYAPIYIITTKNIINLLTQKPVRYLFFLGDGETKIPDPIKITPIIGIPNGAQFNSPGYVGGDLPGDIGSDVNGNQFTPLITYTMVDIAIVTAGGGYSVDDLLSVMGGQFFNPGILKVTSVDQYGSITGISIFISGTYITIPDNLLSMPVSFGAARFNIGFLISSDQALSTMNGQEIDGINLVSPGSGYQINQIITLVGGTASPYPILQVIAVSKNGGIGEYILLNRGIYQILPIDLNNIPASPFIDGDVEVTNALFAITLRQLTLPSYNPLTISSIKVSNGGSNYTRASLNVISGGYFISPAIVSVNSVTNGSIGELSILDGGMYNTVPNNPLSLMTGNATAIGLFSQITLPTLHYQLYDISIVFNGSGYQIGNVLTLNGGEFDIPAIIIVDYVDYNSAITQFSILNVGSYTVIPSNTSYMDVNIGTAIFSCSFISSPPIFEPEYLNGIISSQVPDDGSGFPPPNNGLGGGDPNNNPLFIDEFGTYINPTDLTSQFSELADFFAQTVTLQQAAKSSENLSLYGTQISDLAPYQINLMLIWNPNILQYFLYQEFPLSTNLIRNAIISNPNLVSIIANTAYLTSNLMEISLSQNGALLKYFLNNSKLTPTLVNLALSQNGNAIQFYAGHPQLREHMIRSALNQTPNALQYVINNPKTTYTMIAKALTTDFTREHTLTVGNLQLRLTKQYGYYK